jgi:hypothetical protein
MPRFLSGIRPDERRRWRDAKPIEHLILDDSISEVMVNGADRGLGKAADKPAREPRPGVICSTGESGFSISAAEIAGI